MVSPKKQEQAAQRAARKDRPRRGRPTGQNRTPLSSEEKRARNAQYERERREETAAAMNELADAVGGDCNMSNQELLIATLQFISEKIGEASIEDLERQNNIMEAQVSQLSQQLALQGETIEEPIPPEALDALQLTPENMRLIWSVIDQIREEHEASGESTVDALRCADRSAIVQDK